MQNRFLTQGVLFTVILLFLIGCENSDLLNESALSKTPVLFTTNQPIAPKSLAAHGIDRFDVFGYYTGDQLFQDYVNSGQKPNASWMFNQEVVRDAQGNYAYHPIHYWPLDPEAKISFLAYTGSPGAKIESISPDPITKDGEPIFRFTTNTENPIEDFLISQPARDLTRQSGPIKFFMQHVLSMLRFNIKSSRPNVKLLSVGLKNVYTNAEFSAHGRIWYDHQQKQQLKTYQLPEAEQPISGVYKSLSQRYLVIPQEIGISEQPTFTFVFEDDGVRKVKEFIPTKKWEKYCAYTYNISYTTDDLDVDIAVDPWSVNQVDDEILANQYLEVSTRVLDLAESHHIYYNSSFPTTTIDSVAHYQGNNFRLYDYFQVFYEGRKIRLNALEDVKLEAEEFIVYLQGEDLHGHAMVRVPIKVKTEQDGSIEIEGTFWATGNIISRDGKLDIATSSNYTGLYFRWGSLVGLAGNNAASFQFLPDKTVGFRPKEYVGEINTWDEVPYQRTMDGQALTDGFKGQYDNQLGFDATQAVGDPCRYMSNQEGWSKGKWRMPTFEEFEKIVHDRKIRKINGTWGIEDETHIHETATTGSLPVEAGWFVKADMTDNSFPPDDEFNAVTPPNGWVFFPASGQRGGWTGMLSEYSSLGYYWTSTTVAWDAAFRFQFSKTTTGDNNLGSFSDIASGFVDAYPIRCVRDLDK